MNGNGKSWKFGRGWAKTAALAVIGLILTVGTACAAGPDDVLGVWVTEGAKGKVEISKCGEKYCGKLVFIKDAAYTKPADGPVGTVKTDRRNPDPARRNRPLLGMQIMEGFAATGDGVWEKGTIYDPESGKTYRCKMTLESPDHLKVRGFIGISLLGRSQVWTR